MAEDTWFSRDLPVLDVTVRLMDERLAPIDPALVAETTGLPLRDVARALVAMEGSYVVVKWGNAQAGMGRVQAVTAAARQTVGQWPSAENMASRILETLDARIEEAPTEAERSRWVKIRDAVGGAGRDLLVDVMGSVITRQIGGA